nr:unknown [Takifugu rubripes]
MAVAATGKTVEELRKDRVTAKRLFTKVCNTISRNHEDMNEEELKDILSKLKSEAEKLMEANDDLQAGIIADQEAEEDSGEEAVLDEQVRTDLEKTTSDCKRRLAEGRNLIQQSLWSNFAQADLSIAVRTTETVYDHAQTMRPEDGPGVYDHVISQLQELFKRAKEEYNKWTSWIPGHNRREIQDQLRELEFSIPALITRKADFIKVTVKKDPMPQAAATVNYSTPAIRLKPTALPRFNGCQREFFRWRKDWEALQSQGEPTGSREVKKAQLLDCIDEKIIKDLRLSMYSTADEIFRVLESRYGNKTPIALEIVEELQRTPSVRRNQPRKIVELIRTVEKALQDLCELGDTGAIKNPLVTKSIESKLPDSLKKEWLIYATDTRNAVQPEKRFDCLLAFLKGQEPIYEQLELLLEEEPVRKEARAELRHARTKVTKSDGDQAGCVVCGDVKHKRKLYFCRQFRSSKLEDKQAAVRRIRACPKCLEIHGDELCCKPGFLCKGQRCIDGRAEHHYILCPYAKEKKNDPRRDRHSKEGPAAKAFTEDQEKFFSRLSPELAKQCRDVFSNSASKTFNAVSNHSSLLAESGLQELPVIMMLLEVTANAGQRLGTLIDLASDTNYITHSAASRLNLRSEEITLVVHGVGGMEVCVETKRYLLRIRVKTSQGTLKSHQMVCYGLDRIAEVHQSVTAGQLQRFFPRIAQAELERPKEVDLLISHREGRLAPQRVQAVGDLVLWDGPLGKTVGGAHPHLFEKLVLSAHASRTHFARSMRTAAVRYVEMAGTPPKPPLNSHYIGKTNSAHQEFLKWWRWDSIGTACEPKCGGYRCGNCQPGGKEMTLAEERELEVVRAGLTHVMSDDHSTEPHWHAKYPWVDDLQSLPNNRNAVQATFLRMERKLAKEPNWKVAYAAQVHEMLSRGAAAKLSDSTIAEWTGPIWYISHLIAPNPHSVTTPVRLVWNSSQRFKGVSLNDLLLKGPDVLNQIRAVLLRFRSGVYAAIGDVRKMYNSVWLEDREVHLHRFLWRNSAEEEIQEYAVTRVNIGDKPAGCIAQLAMRETASLPQFSHLTAEREVLHRNAYVDDILTSHNDLKQLQATTKGVEDILKAGGFALKPWVFSGQSGRGDHIDRQETVQKDAFVLPNQMSDDDNKALGLGYIVKEEKLHVMVAINFSKRRKKMHLGKDLEPQQVRFCTPSPLTRRELLSQVSGLYDPVGLVAPVKQKGAILVRRAFQEARSEQHPAKDTWDKALSAELREDAIKLFEECVRLRDVKFDRALTPSNFIGKPWALTFSDGSEHSYGAVMYLRWETDESPIIRLVEAKAKLSPLDQKGEAVKAEVCGAVIASRLKKYFQSHSPIQVDRWFHFVDSQTVLGAIQRECYGFQTFFSNRIGEIQTNSRAEDWWWVPGPQNVADMITRGASPESLTEHSIWQRGPDFLKDPIDTWPVKSAKDIATNARENISKLQRKAFVDAITRSMANDPKQKMVTSKAESRRPSAGSEIKHLVDAKRFSTLAKFIKTVALVWRAAKNFLSFLKDVENKYSSVSKWEAVSSKGLISVKEREDALRDIFLATQQGVKFQDSTRNRLVVYKDPSTGLLVASGRVQSFRNDNRGVPLLPYDAWVSTLMAREAHGWSHDGVAGTLLKMRCKAWVIKGRRVAQRVVDGCVLCRKIRARRCQQVMADLPPERTRPAAPFQFTTVDLFGPYLVKDDVKRRVTLKTWGVVFSCMACRAIHLDLVNSVSSESFLMAYQRFTAIRGHPSKLWSDPGTNFIGAKPVLQDLYQFLESQNKAALAEYAVSRGTEWRWQIHPADSPHRNGAAEAAVRVAKRALQALDKNTMLSYSEFQTVLFTAANLANERPIEARVQSKEDCIRYVSPNSLLLGRASNSGDFNSFDF